MIRSQPSRLGARRRRSLHPSARAASAARDRRGLPLRWVTDVKYGWLSAAMMSGLFLYMCVPENVLELRPPLTAIEEATTAPNPIYRLLKYALLLSGFGVVIWRFALARQVLSKLNVFLLA